MQRGSVHLLLLMATVLFLGGGVYFYLLVNKSPQIPQYNNYNSYDRYNIYSNSSLGFQFEYPDKKLKALEDTEEEFNKRGNGQYRKNFKGYIGYEPGKFLGAVVVLDETNSYETNPFSVWVFDNPDDLTIDIWHHKYWYYPFVWGDFTSLGKYKLAPEKEATVSGIIGKSRVIDYQPGKPKFIYLSKDQKMYLFRIIADDGEKILSTLEIL